jgi:hypothetical protein
MYVNTYWYSNKNNNITINQIMENSLFDKLTFFSASEEKLRISWKLQSSWIVVK